MDEAYLAYMRSRGISKQEVEALRRFRCEVCGFEFCLIYSRAVACKDCPDVIKGCPKVKCPRCNHVFNICDLTHIVGENRSQVVAEHLSNTLKEYYMDRGIIVKDDSEDDGRINHCSMVF